MSEFLPATEGSSFSDFSYLINNNFYDFKVFLGSFDGRLKILSPSSIKTLYIEDNVDNPFHSGFIILDNRQDNIENAFEPTLDPSNPDYYKPESSRSATTSQAYLFNGDCRDTLIVEIMPKLTPQGSNTSDEGVKKYFLLSFNFSIYNTEEINDGSQDGKLKKLYFWESDYEFLREKNSYFSTANYINSKDVQNLSNRERTISTGAALSAAIAEGLDNNDGFKPVFTDFDSGSTGIFFSAPGDFKCIDTVNYILERHVGSPGSNYSPCLLQLNRYPKTYSLRSFSSIFKNAVIFDQDKMAPGPEYLETYKLAGYGDNTAGNLPTFTVEVAPAFSPYFQSEGNLDTYSFDFMAGIYSQTALNNKIVHSYSYGDKQFNIESKRNSIENFSKASKSMYITPFSTKGAHTLQFGQYRNLNKNTSNVFAATELDENARLSKGLVQTLKNYVYLNNFCTFKVQGSTHRQAGKFIGITRENNKQFSVFDTKFLGIYYVVSVRHIFQDAEYTNELICVKTYLKEDIFLNKNVL
jgi:hypothetical protein